MVKLNVVKSNVIKSYFSRQDGDWWSVPLDQLREAMESWFRRKGYLQQRLAFDTCRKLKSGRNYRPELVLDGRGKE